MKRRRGVFGRTAAEDAERELSFHVEMKVEELVAAGWDREEARREAERRFGDRAKVGAECAALDVRRRRLDRLRELGGSWVRDFRFGARVLKRRPGLAGVAVVTLALGVGANAAIFSVVNTVLLSRLPYAQPEQLVSVWESHPQRTDRGLVSAGNLMDWRDRVTTMSGLAAYRNQFSAALTGEGQPEEVSVSQVTPDLFDLLGVRPVAGRVFDRETDAAVAGSTVLLGDGIWRRRFGADPRIVGRTVTLDGNAVEIIGVLPAAVGIPAKGTDFWVPVGLTEASRQQRRSHVYAVIGRLRAGATVEQAQAEMRGIAAAIEAEQPEWMEGWTARVVRYRRDLVRDARGPLLLLFGAVALVLLIACANVSNLLFASAVAREREVAVRSALGAGRAGLIRQFLAESLVLSTAGGALALLIAWPAIRILVHLAPTGIPLIEDARLSGGVFGFCLFIVLSTTLLFGTLPALRASRPRVERALGESRSRGTGSRHAGTRRALVIGEVALSMLLIAGAGLLLRSLSKLRSTDPGFRADHLLAVSLYLPGTTYGDQARQLAFFNALLDRLRPLPGIESVAGTSEPPVVGYQMTFSLELEDRPAAFAGDRDDYPLRAVTSGYFEATGVPVLRGRSLSPSDRTDSRAVALINQAMADRVYPATDPIGRRIRTSDSGPWREIVGVIGDTRHDGLDRSEGPVVYIPYSQKQWTWMSWLTLLIRTSGEPLALVPEVERQVWALDPQLPLQRATTVEDLYSDDLASRRFTTTLLSIFAALALILGIVGLYGVVSWGVAERTNELGVRLALGAAPRRVVADVVGEGLRLALVGVGIGFIAAVLLRRTIAGLLYGTGALDPVALGGTAALLILCSAVACIVPATRAIRVDPATTLRGSA
jgi:putative ABC transport system permease protein